MGDEDKSSRPPGKILDAQRIFVSRPCGKPAWRGGQAAVRGTESLPVAKVSHGTRRRSLYSPASRQWHWQLNEWLRAASPIRRGPSQIGKDVSSDKHQDFTETVAAAAPGGSGPLSVLVVDDSAIVRQVLVAALSQK